MLFCRDPELIRWSPDFSSSGQPSPHWTKLVSDGVELCNSLEWTYWRQNPVQVRLCEQCGREGCEMGGYVHVSRLGRHLLWTRPWFEAAEERASPQYQPSAAVRRFGAVLIAQERWDDWYGRIAGVPRSRELPETRRIDLAAAWYGEVGIESLEEVLPTLEQRLGDGDPLDAARTLVRWVTASRTAPVEGELQPASASELRIETLRVDGFGDWAALATGPGLSFAFGREWVLAPAPLR
jgi:hypothetical protein